MTAPAPHRGTTPPVALTIAGSDSGGGAGIQADLTTFSLLGVHGASAITAVTAQNSRTVARVHVPPVEILEAQLDAVLADLPVAATKTGMLATPAIIDAVATRAARGRLPQLVVDPVLVSSSGDPLLAEEATARFLDALLPHALVATPNAREAAVLLGQPADAIRSRDDQRHAARDLAARVAGAARRARAAGPAWIVVKGGHVPDAGDDHAVDVALETGTGTMHELSAPWVTTGNDHGTGCTFAAATAAHLARGLLPLEALRAAKGFVHRALQRSAGWQLGAGRGPVAHTAEMPAPRPSP